MDNAPIFWLGEHDRRLHNVTKYFSRNKKSILTSGFLIPSGKAFPFGPVLTRALEHRTLSSKMCMFESNSYTINHVPNSDFFIASLDGDWVDADIHFGN
jgi:hypothetical protein